MKLRVIHSVAGLDFFAYPLDPDNYPLADYEDYRVPLTETSKIYEGEINLDLSPDWGVFEGEAIPASYDDALYEAHYTTADTIAGDIQISITPATISQINRGDQSELYLYYKENKVVVFPTSVDLSGVEMKFVVETSNKTNVLEVADGSISKTSTTLSVTVTTAVTNTVGDYLFSFRRVSNDEVLVYGTIHVNYVSY